MVGENRFSLMRPDCKLFGINQTTPQQKIIWQAQPLFSLDIQKGGQGVRENLRFLIVCGESGCFRKFLFKNNPYIHFRRSVFYFQV
jgi:hypothetical protein